MKNNVQNNKVIILNGSFSEIPLIEALKNLGYFVIVLGANDNALGNDIADKYVNCDYSNKEAVLEIAKTEKICGIVSCCHDFGIRTASWVSSKLNLKGHDKLQTVELLHLKDKYRAYAKQIGIKTPKMLKCNKDTKIEQIIKEVGFPLIIKAVDLTTGCGMTKCNNIDEIKPALDFALSKTREDYIIAEEFLEGTNHGFTTLIQNGKVVFYFVDNEQHSVDLYSVSGASTTSKISLAAIDNLICDCNKIASNLQLVDGILHIQFILDKNNIPTILEITRRAPGCQYVKLVEYATGINYSELIVKAELGLPMGEIKQLKPQKYIVRHCIMGNNVGALDTVVIDQSIKSKIIDSIEWWKKGDIISNYKQYKAGIVFIEFESEDEMDKTIPSLNLLIKIKMQNKENDNSLIAKYSNNILEVV